MKKSSYQLVLVMTLLQFSTQTIAQNKISERWSAWVNFNKYAAANKQVPPRTKGEKRVVFLGNSIVEGWVSLRPDFFANKPYYGRGISGQTTPQMLLRFYEDVLALDPEVLVLKAGINDIAQNAGPYEQLHTLNNIKAMAQLARINKIKVILCSVLPASDFKWRPGLDPGDKIIALNREMKRFADDQGYFYLDLYASVVDNNKGMKPEYATDGVHPTVEGYKVLEPLVEAAIQQVRK